MSDRAPLPSLLVGLLSGLLVAALVAGGAVTVHVVEEARMQRTGWVLRWHDEFEGEGLDWSRWNAQDAVSPRNHELQRYTPDEVQVDGRRLRLSSHRRTLGGREFTSGAVDTYRKFAFTYGRVEVRARLPEMGQGVWPAVWMLQTGCNPLGPPCPWPTPGAAEIDVLEAVGSPTTLYTNLHHGSVVGQSLSPGPAARSVPDLSRRFHTYAVEWEPGGRVRWFFDDDLVDAREVPGAFDQPMYLILNTAVGGDWPGPPDGGTPFPQHFDVDFVRVYQRP